MRVLVDGLEILSSSDTGVSSGKIGLRGWGIATWADNLVVTTLP